MCFEAGLAAYTLFVDKTCARLSRSTGLWTGITYTFGGWDAFSHLMCPRPDQQLFHAQTIYVSASSAVIPDRSFGTHQVPIGATNPCPHWFLFTQIAVESQPAGMVASPSITFGELAGTFWSGCLLQEKTTLLSTVL